MLLNLLKNNFGLKVLSVCLALAAWGYFHLAAAPGTTARFDQTLLIPIVVSGLKPGYQARYDALTALPNRSSGKSTERALRGSRGLLRLLGARSWLLKMQQSDVESRQPGEIPGIGEVLRVADFCRRIGAVDPGIINIVRDFAESLDDLQTGQAFRVLGQGFPEAGAKIRQIP